MEKINIFLDDLNGGLYQWDIGQRLRLYGVNAGVRVDYVMGSQVLSVDTYAESGNVYANIPNVLLQQSGSIRVLVYITGEDYGETVVERTIRVHPRAKPSDYIYTETEIRNYDDLSGRVKALEENPAVLEETDPTVPDWAKQPEKPTYTAEEVGAEPLCHGYKSVTVMIPSTIPGRSPVVYSLYVEAGEFLPGNYEPGTQSNNVEWLTFCMKTGGLSAVSTPAGLLEYCKAVSALVRNNVFGADFFNQVDYSTNPCILHGLEDDHSNKTTFQIYSYGSDGRLGIRLTNHSNGSGLSVIYDPNTETVDETRSTYTAAYLKPHAYAGQTAALTQQEMKSNPSADMQIATKKYVDDAVDNLTDTINGMIDTKLEDLPSGGGTDVALGMTGATVGQIAKITAVDDEGKPTAWASVDLPGKWEELGEIPLELEGQEFPITFSITKEQAQEYDGFLVEQQGSHGGEYTSNLAMNISWGYGTKFSWNWSNHAWGAGMIWKLLPRDPACAEIFESSGFSWNNGGHSYGSETTPGDTVSRLNDFKIYIDCTTESPVFTDGCKFKLWGLKGVRV